MPPNQCQNNWKKSVCKKQKRKKNCDNSPVKENCKPTCGACPELCVDKMKTKKCKRRTKWQCSKPKVSNTYEKTCSKCSPPLNSPNKGGLLTKLEVMEYAEHARAIDVYSRSAQ